LLWAGGLLLLLLQAVGHLVGALSQAVASGQAMQRGSLRAWSTLLWALATLGVQDAQLLVSGAQAMAARASTAQCVCVCAHM
jgi:hypothetical protein